MKTVLTARVVVLTLASVLAVVYNNLDGSPRAATTGRLLRTAGDEPESAVPVELAVEVVDAATTPEAGEATGEAGEPDHDDRQADRRSDRRSIFEYDPIAVINIL